MKKKENKKESDNSGVLIPGGLLVGLGVGLLINKVAALTLIGLGAGFIAMWFFRNK
jgi:hypothetical protein